MVFNSVYSSCYASEQSPVTLRLLILLVRSVRVPEGMIHNGHQGQPSLPSGGDDLIGREEEAVAAGVPQLKGVGVLDALVVGPVNGVPAGLVYN